MELTNRADGAIRRNINTLVAVAEKSPKLFDLRLLIKSIVFLLIFAMLATFAPLNGFAATAKSTPNVVTSVEAQVEDTEELPAEIVAEETSMRTENTKHFRMSDGTYQAAMYAEPVHYQDANGTWQDIDNTLIEKTLDGKKVLETTAGASKITLPESFAGGQKATLTNDGYSVAFGLSAENDEIALNKKAAKTDIDKLASKEIKTTKIDETKEELSKSEEIEQKNAEKTELKKLTSAVEYADILPDSSLEYIVSSNGIKENIVINAPQDEYIYKFDIDIGNLTPVPQENGSILLNDGEKAVYVIQPPYAYDAVGEHGAAAQSLDKIDGELMLTITLDSVWANDETRVFPVVLDPTIVFDDDDDNFGDTYVTNNIESMSILGFDIQLWDHTGNNSSLSFMTAGYASGSDSWARGFIKMKLPERPANSVIISATFEQKWRKTYGSSFQINAYEVPYEWVQAHVGEHFTWNNQPFGTAKNSYINNPILDSNVVNGKSLYRYDLTNLFRKQNDLNRNYAYVMLASANESGANAYADFNTVNAIDSSTHPMCNVIYAYPGGLEDFFTHETFGAGRAGTAYVGDYYRDVNIIRSEIGLGDVNVSRTYYPNWAADGISGTLQSTSPYGLNWKTNYAQSLTQSGQKYIYIGDKGQRIEFKRGDTSNDTDTKQYWEIDRSVTLTTEDYTLWVPKSGANITNVVIESTAGYSKFNSNGYLSEIKITETATESVNISYVSGTARISQIIDTSGKKLVFSYNSAGLLSSIAAQTASGAAIKLDGTTPYIFTYTYDSGKNLTGVTYPDGESASYNYSDTQVKLTDVDGYNLRVNSSGKYVTSVQEYAGNTPGNSMTIANDNAFQTTSTDNLGNKLVKQFNEFGQTISTVDKDGNYVAQNYEKSGDERGVLRGISSSSTAGVNILKNHSAELSGSDWNSILWNSGAGMVSMTNTEHYVGAKSFSAQSTAAAGGIGYRQSFAASVGKTYTISAYVKMSTELTGTGGAYLGFRYTNAAGAWQDVSGEKFTQKDDWTQYTTSVTIPQDFGGTIQAFFWINNASGRFYADAIQVEESSAAGIYNYAEDADFSSSAAIPSILSPTMTVNFNFTKLFTEIPHRFTGSASGGGSPAYTATNSELSARCEAALLAAESNATAAIHFGGAAEGSYRVFNDIIEAYLNTNYPNWSNYNTKLYGNSKIKYVNNSGGNADREYAYAGFYASIATDASYSNNNGFGQWGGASTGGTWVQTMNALELAVLTQEVAAWRCSFSVSAHRAFAAPYRRCYLYPNSGDNFFRFTGTATVPNPNYLAPHTPNSPPLTGVGATTAAQANTATSFRDSKLNANALQLTGNISSNVYATVEVPVGAAAGDKFLVGAWAKPVNALPTTHDERTFSAYVTNKNGVKYPQSDMNFNPNNPNWQYLQTLVTLNAATDYIDILFTFNNQRGYAYFDGLQVQLYSRESDATEPADETEDTTPNHGISFGTDDNGNLTGTRMTDGVQSLYSFSHYDGDAYLTRSIDSVGNAVDYDYDAGTGLLQSVTAGGYENVEFSGVNILTNGGFEVAEKDENDAEKLTAWILTNSGAAVSDGSKGKNALSLTGSGSATQDVHTVLAGETYKLSAKIKTAAALGGSGASIQLQAYNSDNTLLGTQTSSAITNTSGAWQTLNTTLPAPENTAYIRAELKLGGSGTALWDEALLEPVLDENNAPELAAASPVNYAYNAMGALKKVEQAVNGLDNNGTALKNEYEYTHDRLTKITHNGFDYNFEYDAWGSQSAVKIGTSSLVEYSYGTDAFRNLNTVTYANGGTISYACNSVGNVAGISLDNGVTAAYTYTYAGDGTLSEARDIAAGTKWVYGQSGASLRKISDNSLIYTVGNSGTNGAVVQTFLGQTYTFAKAESDTDDNTNVTTVTQNVTGTANYSVSASRDYFGRVLTKGINAGINSLSTEYAYTDLTNNRTTSQVAGLTNKLGGTALDSWEYAYDTKGNITQIVHDDVTTSYTCDEAGQLTSETIDGVTTEFSYDMGGNIVEKGDDVFEYDSTWNDKLTSVGNSAILYDALGNPTSYGGDTLTWNGRRLTGFNNFTYTYDADGLRTSKTVNGVKTEYYWSGNTLIGQKTGNDVMYFSDVGFNLNGAQYFYVKNLQGDVVAVVDNNGNFVANYTYDAWGAVISATGTLSTINPIRYRGYYFDTETQLYYLQSRYYNPAWGRFISADTLWAIDAVNGGNVYAYCVNSPISLIDSDGFQAIPNAQKFDMTSFISKTTAQYDESVARALAMLGMILFGFQGTVDALGLNVIDVVDSQIDYNEQMELATGTITFRADESAWIGGYKSADKRYPNRTYTLDFIAGSVHGLDLYASDLLRIANSKGVKQKEAVIDLLKNLGVSGLEVVATMSTFGGGFLAKVAKVVGVIDVISPIFDFLSSFSNDLANNIHDTVREDRGAKNFDVYYFIPIRLTFKGFGHRMNPAGTIRTIFNWGV